ncbi:MAG: GNAT family N-acetyltransferase [Opitutae bacterium]|nr:GNAT family N-acetyltransferase [Opitutae bacterium]
METARDTITITPARPADEPAIRALLQAADLPHEDFAAHLAYFLVARQDGTVVGAVGFELHDRDALLRSLVVAPVRRGAGLGDRLVHELITAARRACVARLYLLTTTAENFFARRGFKRIAREHVPAAVAVTPEFLSLCPASAVCLTKDVPA